MRITCSRSKVKWVVTVEGHKYETWATTAGRAARNVAYRIVMGNRPCDRPLIADRIEMRDTVIERVERA